MITTNASEISKELGLYALEVERKLGNMVKGFISELAVTAIDATPLGDSVKYQKLYELRYNNTGLKPIEGLAQGAWVAVTTSNIPFVQNYGATSGTAARQSLESGLATFRLGQTVYLGNATPYIGLLEAGYSTQAPEGISKIVMAVFKPDLIRYYQGS